MSDVISYGRRSSTPLQAPPAPSASQSPAFAPRPPVVEPSPALAAPRQDPEFRDLMTALVEEALAVSRLLKTQADLLERTLRDQPPGEAIEVQTSVKAMLRAIAEKDRLLLSKLNALSALDPYSGDRSGE